MKKAGLLSYADVVVSFHVLYSSIEIGSGTCAVFAAAYFSLEVHGAVHYAIDTLGNGLRTYIALFA
jgi:hypothetical protein